MSRSAFTTLSAPTPDGKFIASYSDKGLAQLDFPNQKAGSEADAPHNKRIASWHQQTVTALNQILKGRTPSALPPLDVSAGTDFQKSVWTALKKIKTGRTLSYGEIASGIGRPKAVRAVGGACGANPIPVLIPCHRVLAANKKIGGFSGGMEWKRKLLEREGVQTD